MDDHQLCVELEAALLDNCTLNDINYICKGKFFPETLRPDIWQVCLDVRHKDDVLLDFNNIFDLPFQSKLHKDCEEAVNRLSAEVVLENPDSVLHDIESMITFYCKRHNCRKINSDRSGWLDILVPIMELKLNRSITFNMFEAIQSMYIPRTTNVHIFSMFRLLLLYHDPYLCNLLDTKRITPDSYALKWFNSLFAANCDDVKVIHGLWDLYFQYADPFLIFFFGIIILINGRAQILALKDSSSGEMIETIRKMPYALTIDDVSDFCLLAQYYSMRTPSTFKTYFLKTIFGHHHDDDSAEDIQQMKTISQSLCLPVSVYKFIETFNGMETGAPDGGGVRFFLIDCRPAEQYNAGHFMTAFHLDCNLMLQEPEAFNTAIQGLLSSRQQSIDVKSNAGGDHLCFMGSGRIEEDQYIHMIIALFLQKNHAYVSQLSGGYQAMHEYFEGYMMDYLDDHNQEQCMVCCNGKQPKKTTSAIVTSRRVQKESPRNTRSLRQQSTTNGSSFHLFSKLSAVMRFKGAEAKDKLMDMISNHPTSTNARGGDSGDHHVFPSERFNKPYRQEENAAVFSIDGSGDRKHLPSGDSSSSSSPENERNGRKTKEKIVLKNYMNSPDIQYSFRCQEVKEGGGGTFESRLVVTKSHLIILRELDAGRAEIVSCRPLVSIVKITSKRRIPDLITFKYGHAQGDSLVITEMERFIIPNSTEVTMTLSKYIVQILDGTMVEM